METPEQPCHLPINSLGICQFTDGIINNCGTCFIALATASRLEERLRDVLPGVPVAVDTSFSTRISIFQGGGLQYSISSGDVHSATGWIITLPKPRKPSGAPLPQ